MNPQQQEALAAAELAAFVGSHLKGVDQLTTENKSIPANRININNFIAKVKGQDKNNQSSFEPVNSLQQKAIEDAMRKAMDIPEPTYTAVPPDISQQMIPIPTASNNSPVVSNESYEILKSIDSKLDIMVDLIQKFVNQYVE